MRAMRMDGVGLVVGVVLLLAAGGVVFGQRAGGDRPHVVIFLSDDHGQADSGAYGDRIVRTPHLDGLAAGGMRFTRAFAGSPTCSPSRSVLYTGLMPARNGAVGNHSHVKEGTRTLPHYFEELGYRTVLLGKTHIGPREAFEFEYVHGVKPDGKGRRGLWRDLDVGAAERLLVEYAGGEREEPLCLIVADTSPHVYWPPQEAYDPFALDLPPYLVDTEVTRVERAEYYGDVTHMDENLGVVLGALKEHGLAGDTLMIYTSDQGAQWPHAKWNLYDAGIRVPLIVRWPGRVEAGSVSDAMVGLVDVLPTIVEAAGGEPPADIDGRSFLPVLLGEEEGHREAVFATHTGDGEMNDFPMRSIRTERYKYIFNLKPGNEYTTHITDANPLDGRDYWETWLAAAETDERAARLVRDYQHRPAEELYDLRSDPYELVNVADRPEHRERVAALRERLLEWCEGQGDEAGVEAMMGEGENDE